jgi:hypothetical protein
VQGSDPYIVLVRGNFDVLVSMCNVAALSAAMLAMADPDVREDYAERGRRRALDFTPEAVSNKLLDFIRHIAARN